MAQHAKIAVKARETAQLIQGLPNLTVAKYLFKLVSEKDIILPAYKGSAFHGGFGHALRKISPTWYQELFEPESVKSRGAENSILCQGGSAWPKPFVLLPPLDEDRCYLRGREFECELTLFGRATQHISICHAAFEYLGGEMGLGRNAGKYRVEAVQCTSLNPESQTAHSHFALGSDNIAETRHLLNPRTVTLNFLTRLRIKTNNRLCRYDMPFTLFFERLIGRLNTLALFYGDGEIVTRSQRQILLEQAKSIVIKSADLHWDDWDRFSGRQKTWMKFGGLVGSITYEGDLKPFFPYLVLGEWVHVGGKSSFGLGKYGMNVAGVCAV